MNHLEWIFERFEESGEDDFLIFNGRRYSYADLCTAVRDGLEELKRLEIEPGDRVAVCSDYSPNSIFLFFALILNGNIIVPLGKEPEARKARLFSVATVNKCFTFDAEDRFSLETYDQPSSHKLICELQSRKKSGIIIFTSGTSGESKGALLETERLLANYAAGRKKSFRSLIFLKFDHIGGINTLFSIALNGGTIITAHLRTPRAVCEVIEKYRVELLPTTPTFLNMLLMSSAYRNYDLSSLSLITYGTEPMPPSTLAAMKKAFPGVKLKQTYGLTELGIFSTKSKDSHSTLMKLRGVDYKIVDGTLWIRSGSAMLGYLNAPSPFDADGWYNTGDQVEVCGEYLKILGRKSEIINVGGEKVYPAQVESVLLEIPNIKDALVSGKKNPVTGQIVTAAVVLKEPEEAAAVRKRVLDYCSGRLQPYQIPMLISVSEQELVSSRFKKMRAQVKL